jgi:hypothetical protein
MAVTAAQSSDQELLHEPVDNRELGRQLVRRGV